MSKQIDWSKAPNDATHYTPKGAGVYAAFWRKHCGEWKDAWVIEGQGGELIHYKEPTSPSFESLAVERPSTPSWSGEGPPPVGAVCEHQQQNGDWAPVNVLAHAKMSYGEDVVVFQYGDKITFSNPRYFRPIRNPEQIAADEREAAVNDMHAIYMKGAVHGGGLYAIYDAGYRKP